MFLYGLSTAGFGVLHVVKKVNRRIWIFFWIFFTFLLLGGDGESYLENAQKKVF